MKTKELVKKSGSREVKSRIPEQSRPAPCGVFVNSLTFDSRLSTPRLLRNKPGMSMKTKELVKKSGSRKVKSRMPEQSRPAAWGVFVNSSTPRLLDFFTFRRNKPGMSMKTKEGRGNLGDPSRAVCNAFLFNTGRSAGRATDPSPGPQRLMKAPSGSTLSPGRGPEDSEMHPVSDIPTIFRRLCAKI